MASLSSASAPKRGEMGVAMDGGMIHILGEGWKELKIGCIFDVEVGPTLDRETEIGRAHV